ncbi:hypothetical protein PsorP6_002009 [Peronosclerospora sorghi]|uniref:Uncharacterized protein n=1 Tax=Peronosclerospora sorghi TaxID=230839 RepID=A0ACC0WUG1_9STRA|nr:hypothetical protein PsorP6_002009 [Peronosclerospora sorghi]
MELDTNECSDVQGDVPNEETPVCNPLEEDASLVQAPVALEYKEVDEENKTKSATDQTSLDGAEGDALMQSVERKDVNGSTCEISVESDDVTAIDEHVEENQEQKDVEMAEPMLDMTSVASDPVEKEAHLTDIIENKGAGQEEVIEMEIDGATERKSHGSDDTTEATSTTLSPKEVAETELSERNHEESVVQQNVLDDDTATDALIDHLDTADGPTHSVEETNTVSNDEEEQVDHGKTSFVSLPPTHDEEDTKLSTPTVITSFVPHGDDEYDPANPSSGGTPVVSSNAINLDSQSPSSRQELNPDHPSVTSDESIAMKVGQNAPTVGGEELATGTPSKRKAEDEAHPVLTNGTTDSKRARHLDEKRNDDHKHGRRRAESSDTTSSSRSKEKRHEEDHKGLAPAAWDRLMDFQTSGEFRVTQVSRAALASVGAMPEFAQLAIITRFVRTPMRDIRDKNGQLMRIYREYQKENPQIAALQPVDTFISDYKSDAGLFRFGYAPPQPGTGISNVPVPYQRDPLPEDLPGKSSSRQSRNSSAQSEADQKKQHKDVDEFGRAVHLEKGSPKESNGHRSNADPRLSTRGRAGLSSPSTPARRGGKSEDLRRHDKPSNAGRDPRRRGASTSHQPHHRGDSSNAAGSSDLYERLPAPVRAVVDSMRIEGRLHEPLNDNVVTRLLHLPERVALQAVENFSNVDLSQVENLQGFLVGIINRVNEKAIASEKQHRSQLPSPRRHGVPPGNNNHGGPPQSGSVLGGPPQGGRLNNNREPTSGGYRGQVASMAGPALYDRPYDGPQDTRDPRRRQPGPQGPPPYGRGGPPAGAGHGPIGMHSFTLLPVSVQNHVHSLVANQTLASLEELGNKCYEVLGQLSEPLANQVLTRFAGANLSNVRNKSGFLIGVVKRARQEYNFN